mmetsp:Transcript_4887/g.11740  ORF Transcript_4887/g.11740 Transcript_4887/m.11740 type:complete len:241 (-) Transcript_4887:203-925(-)
MLLPEIGRQLGPGCSHQVRVTLIRQVAVSVAGPEALCQAAPCPPLLDLACYWVFCVLDVSDALRVLRILGEHPVANHGLVIQGAFARERMPEAPHALLHMPHLGLDLVRRQLHLVVGEPEVCGVGRVDHLAQLPAHVVPAHQFVVLPRAVKPRHVLILVERLQIPEALDPQPPEGVVVFPPHLVKVMVLPELARWRPLLVNPARKLSLLPAVLLVVSIREVFRLLLLVQRLLLVLVLRGP